MGENKTNAKKRKTRTLEIVALVVALLCITLGFLAFSSHLKISDNLTMRPDSLRFNIVFASTKTGGYSSGIVPTIYPSNSNATAQNAVIVNRNNPTVKNLKANFTAPGQKAVYSFYVYNAGDYTGYLNTITYHDVASLNKTKICLMKNGYMDSSIREACDNIRISIKVGDLTTYGSVYNISGKSIRPRKAQEIEVVIEYLESDVEPSQAFEVLFGDITLYYSMFPGHNGSGSCQDSDPEIS